MSEPPPTPAGADPRDRETAASALVTLRARVDAHFDAAVARDPDAFACRAGCASCCHRRFSVFEVEASPIRSALATIAGRDPELRARIRAQATDVEHRDRCALLVDDRCAVYEVRPLICRTHGLPTLVATETGDTRVDVCPLNYTRRPPPAASLVSLRAINEPLAVMAELHGAGGLRLELSALAAGPDPRAAAPHEHGEAG